MSSISIYPINSSKPIAIPFFDQGIAAGFPSPAQDYTEASIDLNRELIKNPAATFCARVLGDSMIDEGITSGDILVIDRSLPTQNGAIAVCFLDGEFTLKKIKIEQKQIWLVPANSKYSPIAVNPENNFIVWGIVSYIIKKV